MQLHPENLTVPNVVIVIVAVWSMLYVLARLSGRMRTVPQAKELAQADEPATPSDAEILGIQHLPLFKGATHLEARSCVLVEISNDVLLSRLAAALAAGGLSISNTPRGTLRIHAMLDWAAAPAMPTNVIAMPERAS